jgi:hypothetical protein
VKLTHSLLAHTPIGKRTHCSCTVPTDHLQASQAFNPTAVGAPTILITMLTVIDGGDLPVHLQRNA